MTYRTYWGFVGSFLSDVAIPVTPLEVLKGVFSPLRTFGGPLRTKSNGAQGTDHYGSICGLVPAQLLGAEDLDYDRYGNHELIRIVEYKNVILLE